MPGFRFRLFAAILLASLLAGCAGGLQPIDTPDEFTPPPSDAMQWQELEAVREGDWFYVLNVGSEAFDWRLRAIDSAVESIDFQTFIWDLDSAGHRVLGHLLTAAERGVRVRVLVDDSFILDADRQLLDIDRHENIELKVFNPYKRRSSDAALRQVLNAGEFYRLDHRMHNKVMVIDNRAAIIGGRNIAEEYFGYHEEHNFRDMELVLAGPLAQELSAGFDSYWNNDWSFPVAAVLEQRGALEMPTEVDLLSGLEHTDHAELTFAERLDAWKQLAATAHEGRAELLLDRPPEENPAEESQAPVQVGNRLIEAIDAAQEEVWLVSAYLIPTGAFEDAVDRAVSRGVRVRILTNSINSNNHLTAHSAYRRHVRHLVESGAEVHEVRADAEVRALYIESPVSNKLLCLHAKALVLDRDTVFIGSANLDPRSLHINTEMGLLIESKSLNTELRAALEPDFALSNAWHVQLGENGEMLWVSDDEVLEHQPADSYMRRIEDWFLSLLPIEEEM